VNTAKALAQMGADTTRADSKEHKSPADAAPSAKLRKWLADQAETHQVLDEVMQVHNYERIMHRRNVEGRSASSGSGSASSTSNRVRKPAATEEQEGASMTKFGRTGPVRDSAFAQVTVRYLFCFANSQSETLACRVLAPKIDVVVIVMMQRSAWSVSIT